MKQVIAVIVLLTFVMLMASCAMHTHIIGKGAQGGERLQQRQWYVLWGLVPINNVDSKVMAAGATNYTIKTQQSFVDCVINIFTGLVTVYYRTVTVTK